MKTRLMVTLLAGAFLLVGCGSNNNTSPLALNQGRGNGIGTGVNGIYQCNYQPQPQEVVLPTGGWVAGSFAGSLTGNGNNLMPLIAPGNPIPINANLAGPSWQLIAQSGVTGLPVQAGTKVFVSGKFNWIDSTRYCIFGSCHKKGPATMYLSDGRETYPIGQGNISAQVTIRNSGCLYFGGDVSEGTESGTKGIEMEIFSFTAQYF